MKTEKILQSLKAKHEQLLKQVSLLTAKKERIEKYLSDATTEAAQTEEAILALEGKTASIKEALTQALMKPPAPTSAPLIQPPPFVPQNGNLPPAEPGFHWAKNTDGEDILVPDNQVVVTADSFEVKTFLPPIEEAEFLSGGQEIM